MTTSASIWSWPPISAAFGAGELVLGGLSLVTILPALVMGGPPERLLARIRALNVNLKSPPDLD